MQSQIMSCKLATHVWHVRCNYLEQQHIPNLPQPLINYGQVGGERRAHTTVSSSTSSHFAPLLLWSTQ